jgi:hypothetical protein
MVLIPVALTAYRYEPINGLLANFPSVFFMVYFCCGFSTINAKVLIPLHDEISFPFPIFRLEILLVIFFSQ